MASKQNVPQNKLKNAFLKRILQDSVLITEEALFKRALTIFCLSDCLFVAMLLPPGGGALNFIELGV